MFGTQITYRSASSGITVADILRAYWEEYRQQYRVTPEQARVAGALMACRTPKLGGRLDQCGECGAWVFQFNSCRDRHCNQCQKFERAKWVHRQQALLLPIPYFHIVFTTDHGLNRIFRQNKKILYDLIIKTAAESLQGQAQQELGAELGITAVLHTWGQQLEEHIHVHCIVTGGGLSRDGEWVELARPSYLMDVVALSARYRDRLLGKIERQAAGGKLKTEGVALGPLLGELRSKGWEVFAKAFERPEAVYGYLSRYVHQVAMSNYRLEKLEGGEVTFRYYDNRQRAEAGERGPERRGRLPAVEFIRRFMLHVLPRHFVRVRHYGLHHSSARKRKLPACRAGLGLPAAVPEIEELAFIEWLEAVLGPEATACPQCGAPDSLFKRMEFERLSWLVGLLLSLVSQPTRQGVSGWW